MSITLFYRLCIAVGAVLPSYTIAQSASENLMAASKKPPMHVGLYLSGGNISEDMLPILSNSNSNFSGNQKRTFSIGTQLTYPLTTHIVLQAQVEGTYGKYASYVTQRFPNSPTIFAWSSNETWDDRKKAAVGTLSVGLGRSLWHSKRGKLTLSGNIAATLRYNTIDDQIRRYGNFAWNASLADTVYWISGSFADELKALTVKRHRWTAGAAAGLTMSGFCKDHLWVRLAWQQDLTPSMDIAADYELIQEAGNSPRVYRQITARAQLYINTTYLPTFVVGWNVR